MAQNATVTSPIKAKPTGVETANDIVIVTISEEFVLLTLTRGEVPMHLIFCACELGLAMCSMPQLCYTAATIGGGGYRGASGPAHTWSRQAAMTQTATRVWFFANSLAPPVLD
jgi:hypothetical protein